MENGLPIPLMVLVMRIAATQVAMQPGLLADYKTRSVDIQPAIGKREDLLHS